MGALVIGEAALFFAILLLLSPAGVAHAACDVNSSGLEDPLCFSNIYDFVQAALYAFVQISLPILSFFVVYAGFRFVMAQGNSGELTKAKDNFKWLIVGAALILGAWALAELIRNTVGQISA